LKGHIHFSTEREIKKKDTHRETETEEKVKGKKRKTDSSDLGAIVATFYIRFGGVRRRGC